MSAIEKRSYTTYIREQEAMQIFNEYLAAEHGATSDMVSKGSKKYTFKIGSEQHECTIYAKPCSGDPQYVNPIMNVWIHGQQYKTNITNALKYVSNTWVKLTKERHYETMKELEAKAKGQAYNKKERQPTPQEIAETQRKNEELSAQRDYEDRKDGYLQRLPGVAMAQYLYLASVAQADPQFHKNQRVDSPNKHPYPKKKNTEVTPADDFYIVTPVLPRTTQVLKFLNSDKFQMVENEYGFTTKDIIDYINNPANKFNPEDYLNKHDIENGTAIVPSRDKNGVVTNLQKFLVEKFNGADKIFMSGGVTTNTNYVFDHKEKLNTGYQPKVIAITEGWATGRTLNKVLNDEKDDTLVVVSWTANKIKETVENYAKAYPDIPIMIFADNDVKSFYFMNEKTGNDLQKVRNTGLALSAQAYHALPEYQDRIAILVPPVDYKNSDFKQIISDYNDIELIQGIDACKKAVNDGVLEAIHRKANEMPETAPIVNLYNEQAIHYSDLYQLPVKLLSDNAVIGEVTHNSPEELETKKFMEVQLPTMQFNNAENLFDVPVNEAIKTDVDRKMEMGISLMRGVDVQADKVENSSENTASAVAEQKAEFKEPVRHEPEPQAIADPALMTAMLYEGYLQNIFIDSTYRVNDVDEMIDNAKNQSKENKLIGAILDPIMHEHIVKEIDQNLDKYKGLSFYEDLASIRDSVSEDFIHYTAETHELIRKAQHSIAVDFISKSYDVGANDEVTKEILNSDILQQDLPAKQAFYKDIRNTLRNLSPEDGEWIFQAKETIDSSINMAVLATQVKNKENDTSPGMEP